MGPPSGNRRCAATPAPSATRAGTHARRPASRARAFRRDDPQPPQAAAARGAPDACGGVGRHRRHRRSGRGDHGLSGFATVAGRARRVGGVTPAGRRALVLALAVVGSRLVEKLDGYQRGHHWAGFPLAVIYKFTDDQGPYLAALITY